MNALNELQADERCEMCGALKCGRDVDIRPSWTMAEAMRRIADIGLQDVVALNIVCHRVAMPDATYREIGAAVGCSHVWVQRKMKDIEAAFPGLGAFVRSQGRHAQGQKRRQSH